MLWGRDFSQKYIAFIIHVGDPQLLSTSQPDMKIRCLKFKYSHITLHLFIFKNWFWYSPTVVQAGLGFTVKNTVALDRLFVLPLPPWVLELQTWPSTPAVSWFNMPTNLRCQISVVMASRLDFTIEGSLLQRVEHELILAAISFKPLEIIFNPSCQ